MKVSVTACAKHRRRKENYLVTTDKRRKLIPALIEGLARVKAVYATGHCLGRVPAPLSQLGKRAACFK